MKSLLQNKKSRRIFLLLIIFLLSIIFLVRTFVLTNYQVSVVNGIALQEPMWHALATRLLDSIFVSLFVTVFVGLFMFYIEIPDEEKKFEIIESIRLEELFDRELSETEIWFFSGGMGRHTRSKTIPQLNKLAKSSNQHKVLKIQLIDPLNESLCAAYANFRKNLKSANKNAGMWTGAFVRRETLATIISALLYKCQNSHLEVFISLKNNFSTLRIDLSSKMGIITKEDKKEPALICREGSFLYRSYKEEILQTFKIYNSVNTSIDVPFKIDTLTVQEVQLIIEKLNLNENLAQEDFKAILKILKENKNPYA